MRKNVKLVESTYVLVSSYSYVHHEAPEAMLASSASLCMILPHHHLLLDLLLVEDI